jgi:hypothetical protein
MSRHHAAAAFVLFGWYLLLPPRLSQGGIDLSAPLTQWVHGDTADSKSKQDCEQFREALISGMEQSGKMTDLARTAMAHSQCVSESDPRLKNTTN